MRIRHELARRAGRLDPLSRLTSGFAGRSRAARAGAARAAFSGSWQVNQRYSAPFNGSYLLPLFVPLKLVEVPADLRAGAAFA